jgi:hypothetical protein
MGKYIEKKKCHYSIAKIFLKKLCTLSQWVNKLAKKKNPPYPKIYPKRYTRSTRVPTPLHEEKVNPVCLLQ